jgi:hypothetical protein
MPIRPYLAGRTFDPETMALMSAALDEVCRVLQIGGDVRSRAMVARTIIALVEDGKTDSDQLAASAVNEMRSAKRATG